MDLAARPTLKDTQIVIFGGSSGIGLAAAAAAKGRGAAITLVGRKPERLAAAAGTLGGARTLVADIAQRLQVEAAIANLTRIDHLVITAGQFSAGGVRDTDPDDLFATVHERIAGALYAIRAALPLMPPASSIVLTGGTLSDRPSAGLAVLSAAVRGLEALARSLALELKPIRVNVVAPGFVDTPLFDSLGERREPLLTQSAQGLPGGRIGRAEEIAEAILLLLSNCYMNAEVLHVDGGGRFV